MRIRKNKFNQTHNVLLLFSYFVAYITLHASISLFSSSCCQLSTSSQQHVIKSAQKEITLQIGRTSLKMFCNSRSYILLLIFAIIGKSAQGLVENPNLVFDKWEKDDWKFLNLSDGSTALFSVAKDTFSINCTAPYPIQWSIKGPVYPTEFVKSQPYRRSSNKDDNSHEFILKLIIFFTSQEYSYSSAVISCEKIGTPEVSEKYAVFVPSHTTILSNPNNVEITQNFIPCPTTDPTAEISLFKVGDNGELKILEDATYSEISGFTSQTPLEGTFACVAKTKNGTMEHRIDFTVPRYPVTKRRKAFVGEKLEVICSSISGNSGNYTLTGNVSSVTENIKAFQGMSNYKFIVPTTLPFKGVINCSGNEIWKIEVLSQTPELFLDNFEGEVDCLSEYPDRSVTTIRCNSPSDCEFMKHCFKDINSNACNYKRQKQFHSSSESRCWVQKRKSGASCASVPYYYLNGVVQCRGGGAVKHFTFFVGLDFRRYSDWQEAPKNALVKLEVQKLGDRFEFLCQAAAFLFADSLKFSVKYENGTEIFLKTSYSNPEVDHPMKREEFNVLGHLIQTESFSNDVIGLKCHAPWWNSTGFLTTEIKLEKGKPIGGNCT